MRRFHRIISLLAVAILAATLAWAQTNSGKKSYTFHGKVEAVDKTAKTITVNGEKVEGWMSAMTMSYKVDNPPVVDSLKPGDQIVATVYDGDYVLHNVQVAGKGAAESKK